MVDDVGKKLGQFLLNYILDDLKFDYLYFESANEKSGSFDGLEVWSHPRWDKISDKVGIRKRESNLDPNKFVYITLYRLSAEQIRESKDSLLI